MAPPDSGPATDGNAPPYSVSELAFALKRTLETTYGYVRLRGELSKVTRHSSGHVYLSIKDDKACIDGVVWKTAVGGLKARPEQGMEVIVTGRITTYPASSKYQIVIESLEPAGVGALLAQLEKLKAKLQAEGLFEPGRKRRPPRVPATIGVITSPTGAVIRDILHRVRDRWPCRVIVWPVVVQGEAASAQVANAIRGFCGSERVPRPDVLIVARGGGSVEDLWPFNDEALARAVAECSIPLISAVGHETDTTLIDYVADLRAPTPTGAAEMATPVLSELKGAVLDFERRTGRCMERALEIRRTRLSAAERGLPRPDDLLAFAQQRFDGVAARLASGLERNASAHERALVRVSGRLSPDLLERPRGRAAERVREFGLRLDRATERMLGDEARRLAAVDRTLRASDPERPLERGFALVSRAEGGELVRSGAALKPGEALRLKFRDATRDAVVDGAASPPPPPSPAAPLKKPARAARPAAAASALQPDLF